MDVRISYRVPFNEVPNKVQSLVMESRNKLEEATELLVQHNITDATIPAVLTDIERVRQLLLRVDNQLADSYSILAGYNKAVADSLTPAQADGGEDAVTDTV